MNGELETLEMEDLGESEDLELEDLGEFEDLGELEDFQLGQPATRRRRVRQPTARPTLATLQAFSRRYVRRLIAAGRRIDCADLAIEVWIRFGERYRLPIQFKIWDARGRRWLIANRSGVRPQSSSTFLRRFSSTADFVRYVQRNLGAVGLVANTYPVPGGHRAAVAGDVFLWKYTHARTRRVSNIGHTQIFDQLSRGRGGPNTDSIRIVQGNLPPAVPQFRTHPATYFYRPRRATIGGQPHIGRLVGSGLRRFISFRGLR
jgi:hypothetical protein